jgi:lactoylglutathione lyase
MARKHAFLERLGQKDYPEGEFTLAFVGYGDESEQSVIELTYNWGVEQYELGSGYGHIAIEVDDVYQATDQIRAQGGKILRDAGPMNAGSNIIAFVEDPGQSRAGNAKLTGRLGYREAECRIYILARRFARMRGGLCISLHISMRQIVAVERRRSSI